MVKLLSILVFCSTTLFGYEYSYRLKKDELAYVKIYKEYPSTKKKEGVLEFRWSLFSANKLILLVDYEGFKTQYLLEKKHKRDSIRLDLVSDYYGVQNRAFATIKLSSFDEKKKLASMRVRVVDPKNRLKVEFIDE
jgi:hypothetical protein